MAGMKTRVVLPAAEGRRRPATTEPSRRYDPSMYNHLPSWETPLPPSSDDNCCGGDDADKGFWEKVEAVDYDDENVVRPVGKTGGRGIGRSNRGGRGRSVGRGGRGGVTEDGGKSATYWSTDEQMLLVRCKREQEMHLAGLGHNYGQMRTKERKWVDIAKRMANGGSPKDAHDCMKKWNNLFQNYKKI
ncbi:hypothetical protein CBR_g34984 [Chara braunii]|uniref:Myb-like domain-containing protein n=1 Tax=Chara braunii TaxID=69332 RepID=A0A388LJV6_CHABU|nr:hypothetical protein CBR_g34984 [Chara braunii]|eukprot:GBG82614.1 hypothetical protein CBR_g34984 [Chara braunii]